jgi:hypothetical protein
MPLNITTTVEDDAKTFVSSMKSQLQRKNSTEKIPISAQDIRTRVKDILGRIGKKDDYIEKNTKYFSIIWCKQILQRKPRRSIPHLIITNRCSGGSTAYGHL